MRASNPGGRFTTRYEIDSYTTGIKEDLQRPVGGEVPWWRFNAEATVVDDIYAVGAGDGVGRQFDDPRSVKYIVAKIFHGETEQSDRGFYNSDTLRLTFSIDDFLDVFPGVVLETDSFLRDRVVFQGTTFRPTRVYLRGRVLTEYTILTMDLIEVHSEEQVNDPQFPGGVEL